MTPEQQSFLLLQLNRKWPNHKRVCGSCGVQGGNWEIMQATYGMPYMGRNEIVLGAMTTPMLPVCCTACGWTQWWNCILLGVVNTQGQQLPIPAQVEVVQDKSGDVPEWQMKMLLDRGYTA